jgi:hypothetical protein
LIRHVFGLTCVGRDDDFIEALKQHGTYVFGSGFMINSLPWFLKPLAGIVVKVYGRNIRAKCLKHLLPLIKARLIKYRSYLRNPEYAWDAPVSVFQE